MKSSKNITRKKSICILIALSILFFSCSKDALISTEPIIEDLKKVNNNLKFSDDEIFRAVMFLEGKASENLIDFKDFNLRSLITDESLLEEIYDFQNKIIQNIKFNKSEYFKEFRTSVSSGNYYHVKSAIQDAAIEITNQALVLSKFTSNEEALSIAERFSSSLRNEFNINEDMSKEEVKKAFESMKLTYKVPDYVWKYAAVWFAVAAVAVIVIVAFAVQVPIEENTRINNYLIDEYQSTVTLKFLNI